MTTKIEWVQNPDGTQGKTWNPITGCSKISAGCANCYAEKMARRLAGRFGYPQQPHHFDVTLHKDLFDAPEHWKKPTTVFVCSMSDLFHYSVPNEVLHQLFDVMINTRQHTYQILTKHPERLVQFWQERARLHQWGQHDWYPPNIWLGVTVENSDYLWRIDKLLEITAAVRFASFEPLLGMIHLGESNAAHYLGIDTYHSTMETPDGTGVIYHEGLDWCVVGGESGPGARPMHPDWIRTIRDDCVDAGVPFFFKSWGAWRPAQTTVEQLDADPASGMLKVGKKHTGHSLDGKEWLQMPERETT